MKVQFSKYQGTGNDFIIIDDRGSKFPPNAHNLIAKLCDRKFGVGADGLILIRTRPELDYKMVYFNADGSQSLCGNGSRCGFSFAGEIGLVKETAKFETTDGIHQIKLIDKKIHFQLFDATEPEKISDNEWYLNTGSPHHILIVEDVEKEDIVSRGRIIRNSDRYSSQNGTNVNFAQLLKGRVKIRTYERGVEDETLSCGTGATAVGLLASKYGYESPVEIETKGGMLSVSFEKTNNGFTDLWLSGSAEKVFEGSIDI